MNKQILPIFSSLLICIFSFGQDYDYKSKNKLIDGNELEVIYGDDVIYMAVDQMKRFDNVENYKKLAVMAYLNGKPFRKNKSIKVNGELNKIEFFSSDTSVLEFLKATSFGNQGFFRVKNVGNAEILAVLNAGDTLSIPVKTLALDIEGRFDEQSIIDFIGEPTRIDAERIPYNTVEEVNDIKYNTADFTRGLVVKHWIYDKYPGVVLVIDPIDSKDHVSVVQPAWIKITDELFENL